MAQPTVSDVHLDAIQTNISVMYMQDQDDFVAWQAFPPLPVQHQSNKYYVYDKKFWLRNAAKRRAPGTESAGAGYTLSRDGFYCDVFALHHDINDQERANQDAPLDEDSDATLFISNSLVLAQELQWASDYFGTGIWTGSTTGGDITPGVLWSDDGSTPIKDIKAQRDNIRKVTGRFPNTLVLPQTVFTVFETHPDFVSRIQYTSKDSVTKDDMARLIGVDRILVAAGSYNSAQEGATDSYSYIMDNAALLCYSERNPGLRKPSAGYCFMWEGVSRGMGETVGVKKFRMEWLESDRIEGQIAFDNKVVAPDLGTYFTGVLS